MFVCNNWYYIKKYINKKQCVYELLEYTKYKRVMRVLLNYILQH